MSESGDGQDHNGAPRPDALIPALDESQLTALRRPALVGPGLFTRFVPVAGRDGWAAAGPDQQRF